MSTVMQRGRKIAILIGVASLATCAALPFLRTAPRDDSNSLETASAEGGFDAPLRVPSQSGPAPTVAIRDESDRQDPSPDQRDKPLQRSAASLASVTPPPSLSGEYQPPFEPTTEPSDDLVSVAIASPAAATPDDSNPADSGLTVVAPAEPRRHKIVDGDTLEKLAERYLGDGRRFDEIFQANRDVISSPDALPLGVEITIPSAPR